MKNVELRFELPRRARPTNPVLSLLSGQVDDATPTPETIERWSKEAATGNAQAQFEFARALTSVKEPLAADNRAAVKWLRKAAEQDHAQSQHLLAILIARAQGIRADPPHAVSLLRAAAITGYAPAQFDLARALTWGFGVDANPTEALTWLRLAAAQGHVEAQRWAGRAYAQGLGCALDLRIATNFLRKAALHGDTEATIDLSQLYFDESNPSFNPEEGLRWTSEAARAGSSEASYRLALFYWSGRIQGLPKNPKAIDWARRAAEKSHLRALLFLSHAVSEIRSDPVGALALLIRAKNLAEATSDTAILQESDLRIQECEAALCQRELDDAYGLERNSESLTDLLACVLARHCR